LGGLATLSLLLWLWLRERGQASYAYFARADHLRGSAALGLALVATQIAFGGWVSTNYAALACTDFPLCQGMWKPPMNFEHGFTLHRELGETASGDLLPMAALTAIHWVHRVMALIITLYLGWLVLRLLRAPGYAGVGLAVGGLLALQVSLGIGNVLLNLPLAVAVAHNAGAALLLTSMVWLNYRVRRR
jgi:cytochrome c oxidase assembly protein subunit 15